MLYNEIIEEVTRRVESVQPISAEYNLSFSEKLSIWLEDFEHDILLSRGSKEVLSEEYLANAAFDKLLDEELTAAATKEPSASEVAAEWSSKWVDE